MQKTKMKLKNLMSIQFSKIDDNKKIMMMRKKNVGHKFFTLKD